MEQIIRLIEVIIWPSTILLLVFAFRSEFRAIITNISDLNVKLGGNELKIALIQKEVKKLEEGTRLLPDNLNKEEITRSVQTIDKINSLSSTQTKILLILNEGPASRMDLSRGLKQLYGSEMRASVIQNQLEGLLNLGLIKEAKEGIYELV